MLITKDQISNSLFLDIETVPRAKNFESLPEEIQKLWTKKYRFSEMTPEEAFKSYASLNSEVSKVLCISMGIVKFSEETGKPSIKVASVTGDEEKAILKSLSDSLLKRSLSAGHRTLTHNGKNFDIPFISRRLITQGMEIPPFIDVSRMKPWENPHIDTLEIWRMGDFKYNTSLEFLCHSLGVPSSKEEIDGGMVSGIYYEHIDQMDFHTGIPVISLENQPHHKANIMLIKKYCESDVRATANVALKMAGLPLLE